MDAEKMLDIIGGILLALVILALALCFSGCGGTPVGSAVTCPEVAQTPCLYTRSEQWTCKALCREDGG